MVFCLDALEGAVRYWTKSMARDNEKDNRKHLDVLMAKELKNFGKHVFKKLGQTVAQRKSWMATNLATQR